MKKYIYQIQEDDITLVATESFPTPYPFVIGNSIKIKTFRKYSNIRTEKDYIITDITTILRFGNDPGDVLDEDKVLIIVKVKKI